MREQLELHPPRNCHLGLEPSLIQRLLVEYGVFNVRAGLLSDGTCQLEIRRSKAAFPIDEAKNPSDASPDLDGQEAEIRDSLGQCRMRGTKQQIIRPLLGSQKVFIHDTHVNQILWVLHHGRPHTEYGPLGRNEPGRLTG